MAHFNGQGGTVTIGTASSVSVTEWKIDAESPEINTTSTGDGGFATNISNVHKITGSCKVFFDDSALLCGPVREGAAYAANLLVGNTGKAVTIVAARVTKVSIVNPAEDGVTCEVSFVSSGSFTLPT